MAVSIEIGPIECKNKTCSDSLLNHLMSLNFFSKDESTKRDCVNTLQYLINSFPTLNFPKILGKAYWKSVYLIIFELPKSPPSLLGTVLKYLSTSELFAYFSDLETIFSSYIENSAFISFKPEKLRLAEAEMNLELSDNPKTLNSSNKETNDYFLKKIAREESSSRMNLLVLSLKYIKSRIFSYGNKDSLLNLIKSLLNFEEIKDSCQKFLLSLNEFKLKDLESFIKIEGSDINHFSHVFIIETTKSKLIEGKKVGSLLKFSIELLKHGVKPVDISHIDKLVKNPEFHIFALHYVHCYLGENFETFIQIVSSWVENSENSSKRSKNPASDKPHLKITNLEAVKSLDFGNIIIEAISSQNLTMLSFLRGLTGLKIFKTSEDSQLINDFFSFVGFKPPTTLEQIIEKLIRSKELSEIPQNLTANSLLEIYQTLSLFPLHILQTGSEEAQNYIKIIIKRLSSDKNFLEQEYFSLGPAFKHLYPTIIRVMIRTIQVICNEFAMKSLKILKLYLGFEFNCPFCGNYCKDFCDFCYLRKIPVIFPVLTSDFIPDFEVTKIETHEIKSKPKKNTFSEDFDKILKTSLKLVKSSQDHHNCLSTLNFKYFFSCNFLKQFSDFIDFDLDPMSASLIQPYSLMFPKFKSYLREHLLTGKRLALRILESGMLSGFSYARYVLVSQLAIWPTDNPDLLSLTQRSVDVFRFKYQINLQDLLSFLKSEDLCEWAEASTKVVGFLNFLLDLQEFKLEPFLGQIEVELFLKYKSQKVCRVLRRLFKEYKNSAINLFYSSVIVGILWNSREDKMKDLEDLSKMILAKKNEDRVSVKDLFKTQVAENFNQAKIFLICELGLGEALKEWIFVCKTKSQPVVIPDINVDQFFSAFSVIEGIFKEAEYISQNVGNLNSFDLTEFFRATSLIDTIELHDKVLFCNLILGICRLCFHYGKIGENSQFLAAKIIGICGHLLEIDVNLMLQVLEKLVLSFDVEFHRSAVLALAFIGREDERGQKIIEKVLSSVTCEDLARMNELFFMLMFKESACLEPLRQGLRSKDFTSECFDSLFKSLCMNFPLVQYAALSLIPYIVQVKMKIPYDKLIIALNKANSMLSARHHTGELPFSLGMRIDECIGIVGAYYCLEPFENDYKFTPSALVTCERFYSNIERLYLSQKLMENDPKNDQVVDILKELFDNQDKQLREFKWAECKSLREWTQHLIQLYNMKDLFPLIPLIQVNLDTLIYTLPDIFTKNPEKHDYFVHYLTDFFDNGPATYRRLILKVIDKCPSLKSKLPMKQMLNQYLDLNEYPKALHLLETKIRDRVSSLNKRFNPSLITAEELDLCKKVFQGLHSWKFLNSIPEVCKTSLDEQKLDKSNFKSGFYSHLFLYKNNYLLYVAASWRIGKPAEVQLSANIEVCLAFILGRRDKEEAVKDVRNFLIRTSAIRIADFSQAYEHILLQHLFENILGITQGRYSFQEVRERNKVIQDKFIYKEMALRVSYVLYKQVENTRNFVASIYDLFKLGFLYQDYTYCQNFLDDLEVCNRFQIRYPQISRYISSKHLLLTSRIDRKSLESLENLWKVIPSDLKTPEKLGFFSNIKFKLKVAVLIIRVTLFLSKSLDNHEEIQEKYLKPSEDHYNEVRLSLEKGFSLLADQLYSSIFLENGYINRKTAEKVCFLYIHSLKHGQSLYSNSSTRLLLLFFILTQEPLNSPDLMNEMIDLATNLPLFIWADRVNQLVSSSNTTSKEAKQVISIVLIRLLNAHHPQMLWLIGPYIANADEKSENRSLFLRQVYKTFCMKHNSGATIDQLKDFFDPLIRLSNQLKCTRVPIARPSIEIAFPCRQNFSVTSFPKTENLWGKSLPGFPEFPVLIREFEPLCERMTSKSRPAKVIVRCSDGSKRFIICKFDKDCDMRKESRVSQIIEYMNKVFSKDPECRRLQIRLQSYSIMYIGRNCVVVEWVDETATVKSVIHSCNPTGVTFSGEHYEQKTWEVIQERLRPALHRYFLQQFPEPNDWLVARNLFTNSLAAWSIFGYVIGLGDRHGENIMICKRTGELLFIDFECIFNHGLNLPRPEIVPFRMTPELQTAMGLFFEEGEFIKTASKVLDCMKKNRISIMIQFESFVIDPLSVRINNPEIDKRDFSPELTLKIVKSRLEGVEKYGSSKVFGSNKEQVRHLIKLATDSDALRRMYKGWCPWQ